MTVSKITVSNGCWELLDEQIQARIHLYNLCKIPVVKAEQTGQKYKLTIIYNKKEEIVSGTITFQNEKTLERRREVIELSVLLKKKREEKINAMTRADLKRIFGIMIEVEGGELDRANTLEVTESYKEELIGCFTSKEWREAKYWYCDPELKSY
jgi:hypothetical protein